MVLAPSGQQFEIAAAGQRATVVEVGGGIREYVADGRHVLDGYPADQMCGGARGAPLLPWPNRLGDGAYRFDGADHQLALSEPKTRTAIHGLLRWRNWTVREHQSDRVVVGTVLHPMSGYPFAINAQIDYRLDATGLTVTTTVRNVGDSACPFGMGQHPYLAAGGGLVDDATLAFDAATWLPTDERGLPTGRRPVAGTELDFGQPRRIGGTRLDHAFTDLARDADGLARLRLTTPDGQVSSLWADENYGFVQLYSGDTQPEDRRRRGLAVEPMTCPADGLRTGDGLLRIEPGDSVTARWGIDR